MTFKMIVSDVNVLFKNKTKNKKAPYYVNISMMCELFSVSYLMCDEQTKMYRYIH